jgi:DNA-binding transcriptional LysR family regulator
METAMKYNACRKIDLHSMEILVRIAEYGNFSKAADSVGLGPSAVSRRITELEDALGLVLLKRSAHSVRFTEVGEEVLRHARAMVAHAEDIYECAAAHAHEEESTIVSLACSMSAVVRELPRRLDDFLKKWPHIRLDLSKVTSSEVIRNIKSNSCDIGIFVADKPIEGLDATPYRRDTLAVLMSSQHPLAQRRSLSFADLATCDLIGPPPGTAVRSALETQAALHSIKLKERMQGTSLDAILLMVKAGIGVTVLPSGVKMSFIPNSDVTEIELEGSWAERQLYIGTPSQRHSPKKAVQLLMEHLLSDPIRQAGAHVVRQT